jgi:hypothetical protein
MPARYARLGDVGAGIDDAAGSLEALLELSARQREGGLGDAPWPPHYAKGEDEPPRVQPSKRKRTPPRASEAADRRPPSEQLDLHDPRSS